MSTRFTQLELHQLLKTALAVAKEDSDVAAMVTVKACSSTGVPLRDVLWDVFTHLDQPIQYPLKKFFRALARLDRLDDLAVLFKSCSREVRMAAIHAFYNFGTRADLAVIQQLLADEDVEVRTRAREAIDTIEAPTNEPRPRQTVSDAPSDQEDLLARLMLGRKPDLSDAAALARLLCAKDVAIRKLGQSALRFADARMNDVLLDALELAIASGESLSDEAAGFLRDLGNERARSVLTRALTGQGRWSLDSGGLAAFGVPGVESRFQVDGGLPIRGPRSSLWGRVTRESFGR
jgi:hypothetical protein